MPSEFNVALLERAHEDGAVYGSKAVGEPPLMLAFSVREALRDACAAFGPPGRPLELASPATPEAVYWALTAARERAVTTWFAAVAALRAAREAGVLVTVTDVRGHAPREAGAKMVVSATSTWASIGGGNLEEEAVRRAREMIQSGAIGAGVGSRRTCRTRRRSSTACSAAGER